MLELNIYIFGMYRFTLAIFSLATCIKGNLEIESIEWNFIITILSMKYRDRYFFSRKN